MWAISQLVCFVVHRTEHSSEPPEGHPHMPFLKNKIYSFDTATQKEGGVYSFLTTGQFINLPKGNILLESTVSTV